MTFALWKYPLHWLAYGLGAGLVPVMPGTFGSLVGIGIYWLLSRAGAAAYAGVVAVLALFGIFICGRTARDLGAIDPSVIVWDEVIGMLIAGYLLPRDWRWIAAGFVLFRLFDVWKPYPIAAVEDAFGVGTSIMADDVLAAIYVFAILQLSYRGWRWYRGAN